MSGKKRIKQPTSLYLKFSPPNPNKTKEIQSNGTEFFKTCFLFCQCNLRKSERIQTCFISSFIQSVFSFFDNPIWVFENLTSVLSFLTLPFFPTVLTYFIYMSFHTCIFHLLCREKQASKTDVHFLKLVFLSVLVP